MSWQSFAWGFLGSVLAALVATHWLGKSPVAGEKGESSAGFVYLATISLRLILLLIGCTGVYLLSQTDRTQRITAFALGVAAGWVTHFAFALLALRK